MKWLYRLRNLPAIIRGWLVLAGATIGSMLGSVSAYATLSGILIMADGRRVDLGVLGRRVVTDAGVAFMATGFKDGSKNIANFKFHASGTGTTAEAAGDTALVTEVTDNARAAGTNTNPVANEYQTVNTISYTASHAITEHGIFDQITAAGSTLWDRTVFAAVNVASGDSIQFTYTLTINSGG